MPILCNPADDLMAGDDRVAWWWGASLDFIELGVAYAAGGDAHQDLCLTW